MTCLVTRGARAALPMPTRPLSVKTSTTSQPWKVKVSIEAWGKESRSMGLVQKCDGNGTVLPRHSTTRVRISLILIAWFQVDVQGTDRGYDQTKRQESKDVKRTRQAKNH